MFYVAVFVPLFPCNVICKQIMRFFEYCTKHDKILEIVIYIYGQIIDIRNQINLSVSPVSVSNHCNIVIALHCNLQCTSTAATYSSIQSWTNKKLPFAGIIKYYLVHMQIYTYQLSTIQYSLSAIYNSIVNTSETIYSSKNSLMTIKVVTMSLQICMDVHSSFFHSIKCTFK